MEYSNPVDNIITKTIKCAPPYHNIVLNDLAYIESEYNIKLDISYNTNISIIFTVKGIKLDVLHTYINILELINISMGSPSGIPSNFISLNLFKRKKKDYKLQANKTIHYKKTMPTIYSEKTLTNPPKSDYYVASAYSSDSD